MTARDLRRKSASITFNPRLQELLDRDELDWDDPRHRRAYCTAWLNAPRVQEEEVPDDEQW